MCASKALFWSHAIQPLHSYKFSLPGDDGDYIHAFGTVDPVVKQLEMDMPQLYRE